MTITHVTEREMKLANMLQMTNAVLELVTAERDALKAELKSPRDNGVELPEPFFGAGRYLSIAGNQDAYTEAQLRDYGDRRAMAERERAARVCDIHARGWEANPGQNPQAGFIAANNCAYAIRKGE